MSLLPAIPLPINPIYSIAPELLLTGAQRGYTVFVTGSVSGALAKYDWTDHGVGLQSIPFLSSPQVGEYIFVHQCKTSDPNHCSHKSDGFNHQVLPEPSPLPVPEVTIPMHGCADGIELANLVPGARIRARIQPQNEWVLDEVIKSRTTGYYHLRDGITYTPGAGLEIWQETKRAESPHLDPPSAIEAAPPYKNPLDDVKLWMPALCANSITLDNMLNGASVSMYAPECSWTGTFSTPDPSLRKYVLTPACKNVDLWTKPGRVAVWQNFPRCNLSSGISDGILEASYKNEPATLTVPWAKLKQICTGATTFHLNIEQLTFPPAILRVQRYVGDTLDEEFPWPIQAPGEVPIRLPYQWTQPDARGPVSFDFRLVLEVDVNGQCQQGQSQKSYSEYYGQRIPLDTAEKGRTAPAPTLKPDTAPECGRLLTLYNGFVGSEVKVVDNSGAAYSDWITVQDKEQPLFLYRDLKRDTVVRTIARGCGASKESNPIKVAPVFQLGQPKIEPLRVGDQTIVASGLQYGAPITVWIIDGDRPASRYDAEGKAWGAEQIFAGTTVNFKLHAPLKAGQRVNLVQRVCSKTSPNDPAAYVPVKRATLNVVVQSNPQPLLKNQQYGIYIHATDSEKPATKNDGRWGKVTINPILPGPFALGSYQEFFAPANFAPMFVVGEVAGTEYNEPMTFRITLKAALPTSIKISLFVFGNGFTTWFFPRRAEPNWQCTYAVSKVNFTVKPDWTDSSYEVTGGAVTGGLLGTVDVPAPRGGAAERKVAAKALATYVVSGCPPAGDYGTFTYTFDGYFGDARESGAFCIKWNAGFRYIASGESDTWTLKWDLDNSATLQTYNPGFGSPTCS